jgi:hypothetical protein
LCVRGEGLSLPLGLEPRERGHEGRRQIHALHPARLRRAELAATRPADYARLDGMRHAQRASHGIEVVGQRSASASDGRIPVSASVMNSVAVRRGGVRAVQSKNASSCS